MHAPWGRGRRTMALGARGEAVRTLQEELARLGFDPGPSDGRYGLLTRQAVRECQRRYGLWADGLAGPELLRLLREPALRLGPNHAVLGVVDPGNPGTPERWMEAYPFLSAVVQPTPLVDLHPARLRGVAAEWSQALEAAGLGTPPTPPWVWRIIFHPIPRPAGEAEGGGEAEEGIGNGEDTPVLTTPVLATPAPAPAPTRHARKELVTAILRVVDRFRPLAVDLDLEPVLPGDGHRWLKLLASLRRALERRGGLLMATRDLNRRPPIWPRWADDLPNSLLVRNVHLLTLTGRSLPGARPPGGVGAAALGPILASVRSAYAYKVLVEVPLEAARWTQGPDRPLDGPEPLSYRAARVEAMQAARRLRWDDEVGAMTFRRRRDLEEEQYWLPSVRSVDQILRRVTTARLAGIVLNPLGSEDPRIARALPGPLTPWRPGTRERADIPPAAGA